MVGRLCVDKWHYEANFYFITRVLPCWAPWSDWSVSSLWADEIAVKTIWRKLCKPYLRLSYPQARTRKACNKSPKNGRRTRWHCIGSFMNNAFTHAGSLLPDKSVATIRTLASWNPNHKLCVNIHILYLLDSYGWLNLLVSIATSKNRSFQKISQTNDKLLFHLFRGLIFIV
jgi:hypothetical protein